MDAPIAPNWTHAAMDDAWSKAQAAHAAYRARRRFERYQDDPVGFCKRYLSATFTDDIKEMMLSVRDNPVTIARSATGTGKSHSAGHLAVWFYFCFPGSGVYLAAAPPEDNLRSILWGEILHITSNHPELFVNEPIFDLFIGHKKKKHWIKGLTIPTSGTREERISKFSGKHHAFMLFIMDEGDAIPDECYEGIDGCESGGMTRQLILFNPKVQAGPVYLKEREHRAHVVEISALRHPNVLTGEDVIPGAVTRNKTVARIHDWTRHLADGETEGLDTFHVPDFLIGSVATRQDGSPYPPLEGGPRKIIESQFSYKVLGTYPAQGERQLISEEWISAARARYDAYVAHFGDVPPQGVRPRMGLDIAEFGTDYNTMCLRYGGYVPPLKYWAGMDTDATARRALEYYKHFRPEIAIVDSSSLGSNVAPSMVRLGRSEETPTVVYAVGVKAQEKPSLTIKCELGEFHHLRDQLWWAVREWLKNDPGAMLPPDPMLIEELKAPAYAPRLTNGKIAVTDKETLRKLLRRSPDRADALCLTFAPRARAKVMTADGEERDYAREPQYASIRG